MKCKYFQRHAVLYLIHSLSCANESSEGISSNKRVLVLHCQRKSKALYGAIWLALTSRNIWLLGLSFRISENSTPLIPFAKPVSTICFRFKAWRSNWKYAPKNKQKRSRRIELNHEPPLWSTCYQLYSRILPPEARKSPHIYCQKWKTNKTYCYMCYAHKTHNS